MKDMEFSALLCSRLCHDLISPVGAIANGLEILDDEDDAGMRVEVMKLLAQSAEVTSARLKFFRLSFGSAGGFGAKVPLNEAENAVRGLYAAGNIDLDWTSDIGGMDKDALKLMLNMILVAGESLVRGGRLLVDINGENSPLEVMVTVQGDKVIFQDSVRRALLGEMEGEEITTKSAPAFLAATVAARIGCTIDYIPREGQDFSLRIACQDIEKP